jgi:hypothetical protein
MTVNCHSPWPAKNAFLSLSGSKSIANNRFFRSRVEYYRGSSQRVQSRQTGAVGNSLTL